MAFSMLALWLVVICFGVVIYALARQIGVLNTRVAPAGALALSGGIEQGELLPPLALTNLAGAPVNLSAQAQDTLIYFLSPTCPICKSLLPAVRHLENTEELAVYYASDGADIDEHAQYARAQKLPLERYILSQELGMALEVGKLPYGAYLEKTGKLISKGLVNSREHLDSLLEVKRLGVSDINSYIVEHYEPNSEETQREVAG